MPFMYILRCSDRSFYVGSTWDLERRLWQHSQGEGAEYTKRRLPVRLEYFEEYERMSEAFGREKQVQGWGHKKRQALIDGRLADLSALSRTAKKDPPGDASL
ncbi:GIY-YIG nuclease family protein [Cryobacterium melibiosiphilum]|uniref:GIY-YIG nuclease family protein n=1 Tax=Cryobacterium melibiosiphilum TaxID=995039 RepID=A0A3A5MC37_9MICO|nr:GIY-YIG nuclease family protein [Cryobacterium melibiosiphilum]RJT87052.1 GIY-YIG nuclease family protein [Cryobacterium melibiosiphilum]